MNKYIVEFIGTLILVFFGTGTTVVTGGFTGGLGLGYLGVVATALAFGLTIVAGAYAIGHISGCHVNPARALAPAVFTGGEALAQVWLFIVAPLVGVLLQPYSIVHGSL